MESRFCSELGLSPFAEILLSADSFTCVSDAHGPCSWLDNYVSSKAAHYSIQKIEVLHANSFFLMIGQ